MAKKSWEIYVCCPLVQLLALLTLQTCTELVGATATSGERKCGSLDSPYLCNGATEYPRKSEFQLFSFASLIFPAVVVLSFLLVLSIKWLYTRIHKRKGRLFIRNGGTLLRRRIILSGENEDTIKMFSKEEIQNATNDCAQDILTDHGAQSTVYKIRLPDYTKALVVKKLARIDEIKIEEFINELVVLSKVRHKNVVKLVGCCLEVETPLLIYEYIENGSLSHQIKYGSLPWGSRLRIAVEIAEALAYLHSTIHTPLIHRNLKSSNILLDNKYSAKVSDFGASNMVPIKEIGTVVMRTLGYLDPEYMLTHRFNEKSDVYSFGIILLELLTGKAAISYERIDVERFLVTHFVSLLKENDLEQILDTRILDIKVMGQMKEVAMLANRCLSMLGENRPTMSEVAKELEALIRG